MKWINLAILMVCVFEATFAANAWAKDFTPTLTIVPGITVPPSGEPMGPRIAALFGKHASGFGADIGVLGNITDKEFGGAAIAGAFNATAGKATVVLTQLAGLANINSGTARIFGTQIAGAMNINEIQGLLVGVQAAVLANVSPQTKIIGMQVGLYNRAEHVYGFQVGLINSATSLHGLQVGLLNINRAGPLKYFPVINFGM